MRFAMDCSPEGCHYYSGPESVGYCVKMRVTLKTPEDREYWSNQCSF
ncbi:MAG: hypothetical protein GXO65_00760 [Euryarchaeota archaeon]|nr:hypothetical protein [Euryarchaeota archaeon]